MKPPTSVAVYARISSDQEGTSLGVNRQVEDCRKLADGLGWTVTEEYVDNDLSAYSGKKVRPAYQLMLSRLGDRTHDAVIAYHVDRLTRRPIELEQFLEVVTDAGVRHVRFAAGGDLDPGNGDGLLVIRMLAAVAANESATKSRRLVRKHAEIAARGMPNGGSNRPFGYEDDRITVRESEAVILRDLIDRLLAGESLRSLATWLNDEGIPTVTGTDWKTPTLRNLFASARIAGLRSLRGDVVTEAVWDPIITPEKRDRVLALYESRKTSGRRAPRSYLLTGLLRCGKCDGRLYSSARQNRRRYVCMSGPDHGGCGGITVTAPPLEELLTDAVLYRLDSTGLADTLAGRAEADERTAAMAEELAQDRAQMEELARIYGEKLITAQEWTAARGPIETRIRSTERQLASATRTDALNGLVGNGEQLRNQWASLNLSRQHAIIGAVLDHAVIAPGTPYARTLDPDRVQPVWSF